MSFKAGQGYIQVEPIKSEDGVIASDDKKFVNAARVVDSSTILFFRPHGFFEIEFEGNKYCVIRNHEEIILGSYG